MRYVCLLPLAAMLALPAAAQQRLPKGAERTIQAALASLRPIEQALADPARPAADRARDESRHAADILAFAGIRPGMKVADFIMGGGYWTRILSSVVGPKGRVYAYQPAEFIAYRAAYGTEQDAAVAGRANVTPKRESMGAIAFPEKLDAIMTVQNWHDLHLAIAPEGTAGATAKRLFDALKPGGVLLVIDHAAVPGAPRTVADTLHRIDPARARAEIEAAGFRLDGESALLRQSADPKTQLVFDPAIRGRTDQFVYRFRKPR